MAKQLQKTAPPKKKPKYPKGFKPTCFVKYQGHVVPAIEMKRPGKASDYYILEPDEGFKQSHDFSRQFELYKRVVLWQYRQAVKVRDKRKVHAIAVRMYLALRNRDFFRDIQFRFDQGQTLWRLGYSVEDCQWFSETIGELHARVFNWDTPFVVQPIPVGTSKSERAKLAAMDALQVAREARCRERFGILEGGMSNRYYDPENHKVKSRYLKGWKEVPKLYTRWQLRMV